MRTIEQAVQNRENNFDLLHIIAALMVVINHSCPLAGRCCVLLLVKAGFKEGNLFVFILALPYLTIYLALSRPLYFDAYKRIGDLSNGACISTFPVHQAAV